MITIYFDGACEPRNPGGIATYGFAIYKNGNRIYEECGLAIEPFTTNSTNNVAEYTALVKALEYVSKNYSREKILVRGDSQLVIKQLHGSYNVKSQRIKKLYSRASKISSLLDIEFQWIPREENGVADNLSHKAYDDYISTHLELVNKIDLATIEQKDMMDRLGIRYHKFISRKEAQRIISRAIKNGSKKKAVKIPESCKKCLYSKEPTVDGCKYKCTHPNPNVIQNKKTKQWLCYSFILKRGM